MKRTATLKRICLLLICSALVFSGCGKKRIKVKVDPNLVGSWYTINSLVDGAASLFLPYGGLVSGMLGVYRASGNYPDDLTFYSDGTGYADDYAISWSVNEGSVQIVYSDGSSNTFQYTVDSDELVLDTVSLYVKT